MTMDDGNSKTVIVVHDDLDGVGAAALYIRGRSLSIRDVVVGFTKPHMLSKTLRKALGEKPSRIIVADIGLNPGLVDEVVSMLKEAHIQVEWFDHHVWNSEWIRKLEDIGVRIHIDTSTCATGVVAKYLGLDDEFSTRLVKTICAIDLWKWDYPLAPFMYRVGMWVDEKSDRLTKLTLFFASGRLWDESFNKIVEEFVNVELRNYSKADRIVEVIDVGGCRIVLAVKYWNGPPHRSLLAQYLLSRYNADIAVILRPWGGISLRSRRVDVRKIALALGGGGHPRASGAPLPASWIRRLLSRIYPKILYGPVKKRLVEVISSNGCTYIS